MSETLENRTNSLSRRGFFRLLRGDKSDEYAHADTQVTQHQSQPQGETRRGFFGNLTGYLIGALAAYTFGRRVSAQDDGKKSDISQYFQKNERLAIPHPADVTDAISFIKDTLKEEYANAKRDPAAKKELIDQLLKIAQTEKHNVGSFAMLSEARDYSAEVKSFDTTYDAVTGLFDKYDMPLSKAMNGVVSRARVPSRNRNALSDLVDMHLRLAEHALDANDYDSALSAAKFASSKARYTGDKTLAENAKRLVSHIPKLKKEYETAKPPTLDNPKDPKKKEEYDTKMRKYELAISANDPNIHTALGSYLCFVKGAWDVGAEYLAKSNYKGLSDVMSWELKKPATTNLQYRLGEDWIKLAEKARKDSIEKKRFTGRGRYWFETALTNAEGFTRTLIEKRLAKMKSTTAGGIVNLLKLIDSTKDGVNGSWKSQRNGLYSDDTGRARIEIPYIPPKEYDFRIVFTRQKGSQDIAQILSTSGTQFCWQMNALSGSGYGFWNIAGGNKSIVKGSPLESGRKYTSVVKVRKDGVEAYLDGKLVSKWKTDYKDMSENTLYKLRNNKVLGLATHASPTIFHTVEVVEVNGRGRRVYR